MQVRDVLKAETDNSENSVRRVLCWNRKYK
jgi:hypothetical protein